jgi:hypothetical protein
MFNLTGVVSILSCMLSSRILVSLIGSLVLIHLNKMVVLSVNIVILLRLASLCLLMHLFLLDTGVFDLQSPSMLLSFLMLIGLCSLLWE